MSGFTESDVIGKMTCELSEAISAVSTPTTFGTHLASYDFIKNDAAMDIAEIMGISSRDKVTKLLRIVQTKIKQKRDRNERARLFRDFVQLIQVDMGLEDLGARLLEEANSLQQQKTHRPQLRDQQAHRPPPPSTPHPHPSHHPQPMYRQQPPQGHTPHTGNHQSQYSQSTQEYYFQDTPHGSLQQPHHSYYYHSQGPPQTFPQPPPQGYSSEELPGQSRPQSLPPHIEYQAAGWDEPSSPPRHSSTPPVSMAGARTTSHSQRQSSDEEDAVVQYATPRGAQQRQRVTDDYSEPSDEPQHNEAKRYKMPKRNRGIVLIFVNIKFKPNTRLENRERARIHTAKLESCWEKLGYSTIIVREDCTAFEITTEFKKRAKQASDDGFHSFVCCISSHGTDGLIKGSDGGDVKIEDLTKLLAEDEVKNLRNKPKMFFIQACRGYETPAAIPYDGRGDKLVSTDSDFFFGFATTPQRAAARDWYIPELCQTLESNYTQHDLLSMHTMVHDSVIDNHYDPNPDRKYKQQPQVVHMLRKQVWFNGP